MVKWTPDCIYMDLDGVAVDLYGGICKLVGGTGDEIYQQAPEIDHQVIWKKVMPRLTGKQYTEEGFKELLEAAGEEFWENLDPYPWFDELWDLCMSVAPVVIMSSPWTIPRAASGKMLWLMKHKPDALERISLTSVKHHHAHPNALLIDDRSDTCELFRRPNPNKPQWGGQAYCWPQPWSAFDWRNRDPIAELRGVLL